MSNRFLIGLGIALGVAAASFFAGYTIDMTAGQVIAGLVVAEAGVLGTYLRATQPGDIYPSVNSGYSPAPGPKPEDLYPRG